MKIEDLFPVDMQITMADAFRAMSWAEDEVELAQDRHGLSERGLLWRTGFMAVRAPDLIDSEPLFRAHCREILDRIAAGMPLEPGTDAEILFVLRAASLRAPMQPGVDCLYFRLFARMFPYMAGDLITNADLAAYESVHGGAADDHEARLRAKLARDRMADL